MNDRTQDVQEIQETPKRELLLTAADVTVREGAESITLAVRKKGIHGILGPVGAGKGELLRRLAGIVPTEGEILLVGERVTPEATAIRKKIGYVPECPRLDGTMTVSETLELAGAVKGVDPERRTRQVREALELMGLDGVKKRLVARLGDRERWRLALGMALVGNPELLLLENPFSGIPEEEAQGRRELFAMLGRVKTVLMTTATFSEAKALCEDVTILSDGAVLASGSFEELEETLARNDGETTLEEIYRQLCAVCQKADREEVDE